MLRELIMVGAAAAAAAAQSGGSFGPWQQNQVNTSICIWQQPRGALIRDMVYLDGGSIWWSAGLSTGEYGTPTPYENPQGLILTYNLSQSYTSSSNLTTLLLQQSISKARGGAGMDDNESPNYIDGAMLANYDSFFLYGGAPFVLSKTDPPAGNEVTGYEINQYGPSKPLFSPGFENSQLPSNMTNYIAYGGGASAPSENLAWYFSGMKAPSGGPIYTNPVKNLTDYAQNITNSFITVDLSTQYEEVWTNTTLPSSIKGRADPEVVWVPVGERGLLVVLGGVVYPEWATLSNGSTNPSASAVQSPKFMETIDVYDVANDTWYQQPTKNGPGARTQGCAVVTYASDLSSFNIYYYGGFDGVSIVGQFFDDVWVLSLPSFTWTQLDKGASLHARAGHTCFMPYPDQMMVFGGYTSEAGYGVDCLDQGALVMYNVSSGDWMDSYDPTEHSEYAVPDQVQSAIGGHASGGATVTQPAGGWATAGLGNVFAKSYDMSKITTYGPYAPASTPTGRPNLPGNNNGHKGGGGLPSWVAPFLGVVLGLIVLTVAAVLFCLWRKRWIFKNSSAGMSSDYNRRHIWSWIKGQSQPSEKAATISTSEEAATTPGLAPTSPGMTEPRTTASSPPVFWDAPVHHEMADTAIAELGDTSPPAELHDTGLSHVGVIQKHSHFADNRSRSGLDPSSTSSLDAGAGYFGSSVSSSERGIQTLPHSDIDSPTMGRDQEKGFKQPTSALDSAISGGSEGAGQGTSSDSNNGHEGNGESTSSERRLTASPVSPPTAVEGSIDYDLARAMVSPIRKSVFRESEEDLGKKQ